MGLNKLKKCLVAVLSALFACVLTLAIWAGVSVDKEASAEGETYTLTVTGARGTRSIEDDDSGWTWVNSGTKEVVTDDTSPELRSGKTASAVKFTKTSSSDPYMGSYADVSGWTEGVTYTTVFWLKTIPTTDDFTVKVRNYSTAQTGASFTYATVTGATEWTRYEYAWTATTTGTGTIPLRFSVTAGEGSFIVDEISTYQSVYTITSGSALSTVGTLPTLPIQNGKSAVWTIDDEQVTTATVYNYGADKTLVAKYANTLSFQYPDMIESMGSGDHGTAYNTSSVIEEMDGRGKVLAITWGGTILTGDGSPWICLSNTALAAGTYTFSFSMYNPSNKVNAFYDIGNHDYSGVGAFAYNIATQTQWKDYTYTLTLSEEASSLYFCPRILQNGGSSTTVTYFDNINLVSAESGSKTVFEDCAIGTLPTATEGYAWAIDGEIITAETLYTYGEDKTATLIETDTLYFQYPDTIENMAEGSYGAVYNATCEITETGAYDGKALHFAVGTVATGNSSSPWICLSDTALEAGTYLVSFKMLNSKYVNLMYEIGGHAYSATTSLEANVSNKSAWTDYGYEITLTDTVSSLYLLVQAHAGAGDIYIDELWFANAEDCYKTVVKGGSIGELPALADGYFWTVGEDVITAETVWGYDGDQTATAQNGVYYTLTFEGAGSLKVKENAAIGSLPAVPEKEGYTNGRWTIDGEIITAKTPYTYGEDQTAVAQYDKAYTLTFKHPDMLDSW